jgi:hypothetical protein
MPFPKEWKPYEYEQHTSLSYIYLMSNTGLSPSRHFPADHLSRAYRPHLSASRPRKTSVLDTTHLSIKNTKARSSTKTSRLRKKRQIKMQRWMGKKASRSDNARLDRLEERPALASPISLAEEVATPLIESNHSETQTVGEWGHICERLQSVLDRIRVQLSSVDETQPAPPSIATQFFPDFLVALQYNVLMEGLFSETPEETMYLDSIDPYRYNTPGTNAVVSHMQTEMQHLKTKNYQQKTGIFILMRPLSAPLDTLVMRSVLSYPRKSLSLLIRCRTGCTVNIHVAAFLPPRESMEHQLYALATVLYAQEHDAYKKRHILALPTSQLKQDAQNKSPGAAKKDIKQVLMVKPVGLTRLHNTLPTNKHKPKPIPNMDSLVDEEEMVTQPDFDLEMELRVENPRAGQVMQLRYMELEADYSISSLFAEHGMEDYDDYDEEGSYLGEFVMWVAQEVKNMQQEFRRRSNAILESVWRELLSFRDNLWEQIA